MYDNYIIILYVKIYDSIMSYMIHTCFILDCEIAQHQLSVREMAADHKHELQHYQQKVKHLESTITNLYQTAEVWKIGNK